MCCCTATSFAAPPQTINYQGYLKDGAGSPVSSPAKAVGFALYSTATGGAPLWSENQDVVVDKGVYSVELGAVSPLALPFDSRYYLGITVPPDPEMTPRQALSNAPYTFRAKTAEGISLACSDGGVMIYQSGVWQCGSVTTLPNAAATCIGPSTLDAAGCTISMCAPGWGNCNTQVPDGCEMDLKTNTSNCGTCSNACPPLANMNSACTSGVCVQGACQTGWGNCNNLLPDGCETNTVSDLNNCGMCGNTCMPVANSTQTCAASACAIATCNPGFGNCNGIYADGCETNLSSSAAHCGMCGFACASGICSNSVCLKTRGSSCAADNECSSGFCTDGVCCEARCGGTCESCAQVGRFGFCDAIPNGQDPANECNAQSASTCGTNGLCSGSRTCALYSNGTVAAPASCSAGTFTFQSTCNGLGGVNTSSVSCSPYTCANSLACATSCSIDLDCAGGYYCNISSCSAKLGPGSTCATGNQCISSTCSNSLCL